jgi:hypothetical protein
MAIAKIGDRSKAVDKNLGVGRVSPIPLEWMGPPAWRLPSGKALAEFALQAGFLAPLLLGDGPFWRKKRVASERTAVKRPDLRESGRGLP